jgi:multiple sugar transport system permease protein
MARRDQLLHVLRDCTAVATVGVFMFPIVWTALDSVKPGSAVFDKDGVTLTNFLPTLANYATVLGAGPETPEAFDSRQSIVDSILVAVTATLMVLAIALPMAFAVWRFRGTYQKPLMRTVLFAWMIPPIVLIIPIFQLYHTTGLLDTRPGLILAQAAIHLPLAILVLKSFFDDLPPEVAEAATIDGASEWQVFARISAPMIRSGIAATAILVFIFCWTEFFMAVFLSAFTRLLPVQISIMSNAMGGSTMALSTLALVPCFVFALLTQKHLVRGMSLGMQR